MTSPPLPDLVPAIERRYAMLANGSDALSCGGALDHAEPRSGEVLVDLGCGRGQDVARAARLVGPSGRAIGVDRTQAMIDRARATVPGDIANADYWCCDLVSLPLPDGSADVVVSNCAINHAADKAAVYREIHRILKPGGRCVVSDIVAESELPESVRDDPAAWAACYGGAIPLGQYLAFIRDAGFLDVELLRRSEPYERGGVLIRSLTLRAYKPREEPSDRTQSSRTKTRKEQE